MAYNFKQGWAVNEDAPSDSLEAKVAYIDNGTRRLGPERYYDKAWMDREWDRLWTRTWLIAGVASDIPEPGDYFTFDLGRESFVITRDDSDQIHALYNVCPHRGNRLVHNDSGSIPRFTCSFHSWQFEMDGTLMSITDEDTFRPEVVQHRSRSGRPMARNARHRSGTHRSP